MTGVRYWRPVVRPRWTTMAKPGRRPAKVRVTWLVTRRLKRPRVRGSGMASRRGSLRAGRGLDLGAAFGLGADRLQGRCHRRVPAAADDIAPPAAQGPEVGGQLTAVVEGGP